MSDLGDSWREYRDYKKKVKNYHEIACVHCGRKQNWEAPRCIKCGRTDWYGVVKTEQQHDEAIEQWLNG